MRALWVICVAVLTAVRDSVALQLVRQGALLSLPFTAE
jgi:hypothetical protein